MKMRSVVEFKYSNHTCVERDCVQLVVEGGKYTSFVLVNSMSKELCSTLHYQETATHVVSPMSYTDQKASNHSRKMLPIIQHFFLGVALYW